jgi:Protein of unknown function (DUF3485)
VKLRRGKLPPGVWLWPMVSILMLLGMIAEARTHVQPAVAEPHLARCRAAIDAFPITIRGAWGVWMGRDTDVPVSATQLLRPNKILSRDYLNDATKTTVSLLIVDCGDARDLQGHYPPNCYPAQGQKLLSSLPRTWHLPHMDITGMEYHFAPKSPTDQERVVYNFFVMPVAPGVTVSHKELDGVICPDITSVYTSGEDYQRRYYGAAEFQLVTGPRMTEQQRDQALLDLLSPNETLIRILENREPGGN